LLGAVAAVAVLPHDGLENEDGSRRQDDLALDLLPEVGAAERQLGGLGADAVGHVEVGEPRGSAVVGLAGGDSDVPRGGAGLDDLATGVDDVHIAAKLGALAGVGLDADTPRPSEVRRPPLEVDTRVVEEHVALLQYTA